MTSGERRGFMALIARSGCGKCRQCDHIGSDLHHFFDGNLSLRRHFISSLLPTPHAATMNILLALTKALEEADCMRTENFEEIIRVMAEAAARNGSPADFADQLQRPPKPSGGLV